MIDPEHQHRAPIGGEAIERAQGDARGLATDQLGLRRVGIGALVIFARVTVEPRIDEAPDPAPRLARLERDVARDAEQPRRDPLGIAERFHPPEGPRERLLERVVGRGAIAEQPLEKPTDPRPVLRVHGGEERGIRRHERRSRARFRGLGRVVGDDRRRDVPRVGDQGHGGTVARWARGLQVTGDFFRGQVHPARDVMNPARSLVPAFALAIGLSTLACGGTGAPGAAPPPPAPSAAAAPMDSAAPAKETEIDRIRVAAKKLDAIVTRPEVKRFLAHALTLPHIATRTIYHDEKKTHFYTEQQASALPPAEKAALKSMSVDEDLYYNAKYGSPLSYSRPLDILFSKGLSLPAGSRVLDFGYGYVGHLRLLATMGVDATGVDVDPFLTALYGQPGDQGEFTGPEGDKGHVRLLEGRFPADPAIVTAVGAGYDLVISKNVLKKGYIHPDRPADEKFLIKLGASDEVVLKSFFAELKPGGTMLVYNICPALTPPDKPFIPWSDGRSPFTRQQWEAAGFKVDVFDQDDTAAVRVMGHALGWGDDPEEHWDIDHDLSVIYTLVERPR